MHNHISKNNKHEIKIGKKLLLATILNLTISIFEVAGAIISNSVSLLSDAFHNLGDTFAVALAYISNRLSTQKPTESKTFGLKRIEIITALFNGVSMFIICIYIFYEAIDRLYHPKAIDGLIMTIVAIIGLIANLAAVSLLQNYKNHNINVRAAYIHLFGDFLSSIAVVIGGILIYTLKIWWLDSLLTLVIGLYILKETISVIKEAYTILIQATPPELNLNKIKQTLENLPSIDNVHHIHAWKLNDSTIHFECHIDLKEDYRISQTENILYQVKSILLNDFNIQHTTIQFEYNSCDNKNMIYH